MIVSIEQVIRFRRIRAARARRRRMRRLAPRVLSAVPFAAAVALTWAALRAIGLA